MEIYASFISSVEAVFKPLGLMESCPKRMLTGAVLGAILVSWIKPSIMFTANGTARPWSLMQNGTETCGAPPTNFPWFIVPFITGAIFGSFI